MDHIEYDIVQNCYLHSYCGYAGTLLLSVLPLTLMSLPQITLSTAANPLTKVLPKTPGLTPAQRAVERFSVTGNAIGEFDLIVAGLF
jgi:hypothetical protein